MAPKIRLSVACIILLSSVAVGAAQSQLLEDGPAWSRTKTGYLSNHRAYSRFDTNSFAFIDTEFTNFDWWPRSLGFDFFLDVDVFGYHLFDPGPAAAAAGIGGEIRYGPYFLAFVRGISQDDGLGGRFRIFDYVSGYAGTSLHGFRLEAGGIWTIKTHDSSFGYSILFLGINRRLGGIIFVEPEVRVLFPLVSRLDYQYLNSYGYPDYYEATRRYRLRDLFFGFSVKIGLGFD